MLDVRNIFMSTIYLIKILGSLLALTFFSIFSVITTLRGNLGYKKQRIRQRIYKSGLFHPYCNAGGGGERVLWVAIQALQKNYPKAEFFIYTGDVEATPIEIIEKVRKNFNVDVSKSVKFIYLNKRKWVEADQYPIFTLLGQALGSLYLGLEALSKLNPDVFIETTGFTFTLPLFKYLGGCKTGCYVHYPTITKDMLKRVRNRQAIYNNRAVIARNPALTMAKLVYYHVFAWIYSLAGQCSDSTLVNSTFTQEHLNVLWNRPLHLVYPPCEVDHLKKIPRAAQRPKRIRIMSLAQFRPEKTTPYNSRPCTS
ncbi:hypothetical protein NQ318_015026 [Aromia moschata]|uniref:ALG11 mannosyltransferase N-terminal domain-containing protein n=1 Tax=Aromia moschata TaxID=1265417 RepID=A0AAV8YZT7_9CUCU|nr:hypothetical protein NQ318_015026 [Aromia moschata]